jgi:hypothetical protein
MSRGSTEHLTAILELGDGRVHAGVCLRLAPPRLRCGQASRRHHQWDNRPAQIPRSRAVELPRCTLVAAMPPNPTAARRRQCSRCTPGTAGRWDGCAVSPPAAGPSRHATPRHGYVRAQPRRRGYSTRHRPGLGRSVTCHDVDARWWQASRSSWAGRDLDPLGVPDPEPLPGDRRPSVPSRSISYSWSIRLPYALRS